MRLRYDTVFTVSAEPGLGQHAERIHQALHFLEVVPRVQIRNAIRFDFILAHDVGDDTR